MEIIITIIGYIALILSLFIIGFITGAILYFKIVKAIFKEDGQDLIKMTKEAGARNKKRALDDVIEMLKEKGVANERIKKFTEDNK